MNAKENALTEKMPSWFSQYSVLENIYVSMYDHRISVDEYKKASDAVRTWLLFEGVEIIGSFGEWCFHDIQSGRTHKICGTFVRSLTCLREFRPDLFP